MSKKEQVAVKKPEPKWEVRDRIYYLKGKKTPLTQTIPGKHTKKYSLLYFDEVTGKQRELKYATNQDSPFVDEQKGECTMGHIRFDQGKLLVGKEKQNLQKLLSLYHPLKGKIYEEYSAVEEATDQLVDLELEIEALNAAKLIDVDGAEAILRVEYGSQVSNMSTREIKRDIMLFAKQNAKLFIALANDENVQLRNFAIKATDSLVLYVANFT